VGLLVPLEQLPESAAQEDPWEELIRLGALIGTDDQGRSPTDLLLEMRNEEIGA